MQTIATAAFAVCLMMISPRADACSVASVDLFTRYDAASAVATGRSGTARTASRSVSVDTLLKGTGVSTITFAAPSRCEAVPERDRRVIAFADGQGRGVDFVPWSAATVEALTRWGALAPGTTNTTRLELLSKLARSPDPVVARSARTRRDLELRRLRKADHLRR